MERLFEIYIEYWFSIAILYNLERVSIGHFYETQRTHEKLLIFTLRIYHTTSMGHYYASITMRNKQYFLLQLNSSNKT